MYWRSNLLRSLLLLIVLEEKLIMSYVILQKSLPHSSLVVVKIVSLRIFFNFRAITDQTVSMGGKLARKDLRDDKVPRTLSSRRKLSIENFATMQFKLQLQISVSVGRLLRRYG